MYGGGWGWVGHRSRTRNLWEMTTWVPALHRKKAPEQHWEDEKFKRGESGSLRLGFEF